MKNSKKNCKNSKNKI